jgi:hypothetical protein
VFVLRRARSVTVELDRICNTSPSLCVSFLLLSAVLIHRQLTHSLTPTDVPAPTAVVKLVLKLRQQRPQALHLPVAIHHLPFPDLGFGGR